MMRVFSLWVVMAACLFSGCAAQVGQSLQAEEIVSLNNQLSLDMTQLGAGDLLSLKCYHNPRLNDEVAVRPDGNISLQLIGDITALGMTPEQLSGQINARYAEIFKTSISEYVMGVGDMLSIKFYYNGELNEDLVVRPDGNISLQLLGEVRAAGLSPAQLNAELKERCAKLLDNTNVTVIVRDFKLPAITVTVKDQVSRKVYVGGEVAKPGPVYIGGKLRVFDAVAQTGGALNSAALETVVLVRYNGTPKPDVYSLDLNKVQQGKLPDLLLKSYDIVYIPKTAIAQVNLYVEQYLNSMIPRSVSFPITYELNSKVKLQ